MTHPLQLRDGLTDRSLFLTTGEYEVTKCTKALCHAPEQLQCRTTARASLLESRATSELPPPPLVLFLRTRKKTAYQKKTCGGEVVRNCCTTAHYVSPIDAGDRGEGLQEEGGELRVDVLLFTCSPALQCCGVAATRRRVCYVRR